jgi:hypothetical protein
MMASEVKDWMDRNGFERVGVSWMSRDKWARVTTLSGGRVMVTVGVSTRG